jgi:hypothetical protein
VYAHLHDTINRAEFEWNCQTSVDVQGRLLRFDPQSVTADAEWVKQVGRGADADGARGAP